jgi:hypothetical protein
MDGSARPPWRTSASPEGHVEPSGKVGSHGGPYHGTPSHWWDGHDHAQQTRVWEPRSNLTWPRSFHHDDIHTPTTTGVMTTVFPNSLSTQIQAHAPPILDGTKAHESKRGHSASHQCTERLEARWPLHYRINCTRRIRRKMVVPEATFFAFLFHLFSISPFYHECNPIPPLGNYKTGGRSHI